MRGGDFSIESAAQTCQCPAGKRKVHGTMNGKDYAYCTKDDSSGSGDESGDNGDSTGDEDGEGTDSGQDGSQDGNGESGALKGIAQDSTLKQQEAMTRQAMSKGFNNLNQSIQNLNNSLGDLRHPGFGPVVDGLGKVEGQVKESGEAIADRIGTGGELPENDLDEQFKDFNPLDHPEVQEAYQEFKDKLDSISTEFGHYFNLGLPSSGGSLPVWEIPLLGGYSITVDFNSSDYSSMFSMITSFLLFASALIGYSIAVQK